MNMSSMGKLLKETYGEWTRHKAPRLGAALAYYTAFSLAPLLMVLIGAAGLFLGQKAAENQVAGQIQTVVGPKAAASIQQMIAAAHHSHSGLTATIVGIVVMLIGSAGIFGQLQDALNTIWEVAPKPGRGIAGMLRDRLASFSMVLGCCVLLLIFLLISAMIGAVGKLAAGSIPFPPAAMQGINFVVTFAILTLLIGLIYKVLPDVDIHWRDVWVGAGMTSLLFTIGKLLIGLYLGRTAAGSTFGTAASLVMLLLWVYYSAQIFFFGAEFTRAYANRYGSHVVPSEGAVSVTEEMQAKEGIAAARPAKQ